MTKVLSKSALAVAAICLRKTPKGKSVLLITSRDTGRWIVPKGWPIAGLKDHKAALREAWEEAGVKVARISRTPVGSFTYRKVLDTGDKVTVEAHAYVARVDKTAKKYPECDQRERRWVSLKKAARLVREPGLKKLLRKL